MKKILILAAAALALVACEKKTETTGAEGKDHEIQTEFTVKISGEALKFAAIQYNLVDFDGNKVEGILNGKYDANGTIEFKKVFKTSTPGKKATFQATAMTNPDFDYVNGKGAYEVSVYEKTTGDGLKEDSYGDRFGETNPDMPMCANPMIIPVMGAQAMNRFWGDRTLTVTHTADGYTAECPE